MTFQMSPAIVLDAIPPLDKLALEPSHTTNTAPDNGTTQHNAEPGSKTLGGKYTLGKPLARGSYAEVRVATLVADPNAKFAVKVLKKPPAPAAPTKSTKGFVASPETEAACLLRVQGHPNIVKLHEVAASRNHFYLVQQFADGGDLFDEIVRVWRHNGATVNHGGLHESIAAKYFRQLLSAVHFMHARGVAHRDIKSENILLTADKSHIVLADFGFATDSKTTSERCGTLDYVAPEILTAVPGLVEFDPKIADVWACVVVLFSMLTARLPFDAHNNGATAHRIKTRTFEFPQGIVAADAQDLIKTVFQSSPQNRPTIEDLMLHPFMLRNMPPVRVSKAVTRSLPPLVQNRF